jgi:hypothetical protein
MNRFIRIKRVYDNGETGPFIVNLAYIQAVLPDPLNHSCSLIWIHGYEHSITVAESFKDLEQLLQPRRADENAPRRP